MCEMLSEACPMIQQCFSILITASFGINPEAKDGPNPARDDVQQTAFSYDVLGRYICNNWDVLQLCRRAEDRVDDRKFS